MQPANDPQKWVRMAAKPETRSIARRIAGATEKPLWRVLDEALKLLEKELKL